MYIKKEYESYTFLIVSIDVYSEIVRIVQVSYCEYKYTYHEMIGCISSLLNVHREIVGLVQLPYCKYKCVSSNCKSRTLYVIHKLSLNIRYFLISDRWNTLLKYKCSNKMHVIRK